MSYYPLDDYEASHLKMETATCEVYVDINTKRWEQVVVFESHEEFEKWRENHPWSWNVVKINKIEKDRISIGGII